MIQELKIDYSIFFLQLLIFHDIILSMTYVIDGIEYDVIISKKNNQIQLIFRLTFLMSQNPLRACLEHDKIKIKIAKWGKFMEIAL